MARKYKRDGNGRFAGGGGGSSGGGKRPAAKPVSRGVNRLTRDNAGKITSVGGQGATARGGRLRTAAGNKRAMQTAKVSGGSRVGTMKGKVKRDPGAAGKAGQGNAAAPKTPSNKIAASPRQLSKNEQIARDVMTNKSFRSDRQRIAEMQRRGIDRNTDFVGLVANVRAKQGGGTTAKIKPATAVPKPAATEKSRAAKPAAPKPAKPATAANSIRPIARSKPAASKIVPITRKKKPTIKEKAKEVKGLMRKMGRSQTREALSSSNLDREIARQSGATKVARTTVQRRQQRAFNVQNGRNPRIGSKALYVYQSQLKELGSTSNKRVPFRRKPMTEAQAKKAASARNAADQKRLLKAINADTASRMPRAPKPKRKRKP